MKNDRSRRRHIDKLTAKEVKSCQFFAASGRRINAHKVEIKFQGDNNVVVSAVFFADAPHKQTVIRWYNHRYYTLQYGAKEVKPYSMTLAKWKSMNNG